jgi:hypothetical protein
VLRNPAKHGTFVISNQREVLAKNANCGDMKNLPITSRPTIDRVRSFVCSQLPNSWQLPKDRPARISQKAKAQPQYEDGNEDQSAGQGHA